MKISIEILREPPFELAALVRMINDVYDVAEDGMWKQKGLRTNENEIRTLIQEQRMIVAKLNDHSSSSSGSSSSSNSNKSIIAGCVKVDRADKNTAGELGMLAVNPSVRGQGIGGKLIAAAEDWAKNQGYQRMQLELLTPRDWKNPSKEFNKGWYSRLGYIPQQKEPFEKDYADLVEFLATPCDFTIWKKDLV